MKLLWRRYYAHFHAVPSSSYLPLRNHYSVTAPEPWAVTATIFTTQATDALGGSMSDSR
ncbi:hypothetical protein IWX65_003531 [Arthrobacter sp. CAN_A214]